MRTLLIGLDAACSRVLDPLAAAGEIPRIAAIREAGVAAPLASQIPPWTASAWPTLYTGTNPGKHGVFDFLAFDGYDWDVVTASDVRTPALWEILTDHGLSSVVVNVPVTAPPPEIDGAVVPGYTAPEGPACHPDGLLDEIEAAIGGYRVYPRTGAESTDERVEGYREVIRMRGDATSYLVDRYDPAFCFVQFQVTDTVFHECAGASEAVRAVYRAVDEQVGRLYDRCAPETVVVASDHGMGPYEREEFRVNEFLRRRGYVATRRGGLDGMPSWGTLRERLVDASGTDAERPVPRSARLMRAAASVGVTSQRLEALLDRLGLTELALRVIPRDAIRAGTDQVDFARSTAYMRSRIECGVRLNVEGREPAGVVPEGGYEAVRRELIDELAAVRTPDGSPVFDEVGPREAYFEGPAVGRAVDVVTVPAGFEQFLSARLGGGEFAPPSEPWNHTLEGTVAIAGEGIEPGWSLEGARLVDVAPTVLALCGVARTDAMDGEVLPVVDPVGTEAYDGDWHERRPAGSVRNGSSRDVERRLSDLGYLEDR
ncbi:alkaline phosphatase family protein [Natronorarus salvus]|uniref:alkaline phosphatase family protein n=1 Tax=Natronorarus salvus TaxID=3117733 RepID=UPI002F26CF9B